MPGMTSIGSSSGPQLEATYLSRRQIKGLTHDLYRYPARFSAELAAAIIDQFSRPGDVILDPFMGAGTTAVEALGRGRRVVGFDINPLAVLLADVKTTPLRRTQYRELERWAAMTKTVGSLPDLDDRTRNAPPEIVEWFRPRLANAATLSDQRLRNAARALLVDVGQRSMDGRSQPVGPDMLGGLLKRSVTSLGDGLADFSSLGRSNGLRPSQIPRHRILRCGSAQTLSRSRGLNRLAGRVSLVLTSPPYPGIHVLYHRWQVRGRAETPLPYWLANLQDGLGPTHYTMGGRSARGEDQYFDEILTAWSGISRLLQKRAIIVQVLAFAEPERQLDRYLATLREAGFARRRDLEPVGWRDVPNRRWYFRVKPERGQAREVLLIHQAP
jgi:hypothetical protein